MNFEEQIKSIVESSSEEIKTQVQAQLKENIIDSLTWNLRSEVSEIVKKYIQEEMKDEIKTLLDEQKPAMLEEIRNGIIQISADLAKQMTANAIKNLGNSWNVKKITEAMFQ